MKLIKMRQVCVLISKTTFTKLSLFKISGIRMNKNINTVIFVYPHPKNLAYTLLISCILV